MILTQAQAKAVYSAMCALNDVGASARKLHFHHAIVNTESSGYVHIYSRTDDEYYNDQAAFVAAYGLQ